MPRINPPLTAAEKSKICALFSAGFDIETLVERYGRHEKTIKNVLRKGGFQL